MRAGWIGGQATGVATAGGEVAQQGIEAVDRETVGSNVGTFFDLGRSRSFGGVNRISVLASMREVFVVEQQRRQIAAHVPFDIVGQHTEQNMGTHMVLSAVVNRANPQIDPLEAAEGALDLGQALIAPHRVLGRATAFGLAGAHDINAVHLSFPANRFLSPGPAEEAIGDGQGEVLTHLVAV